MLHQSALFFHIAAIMLIGGGSISAILAEKQLWKNVNALSANAKQWMPVIQIATKLIFIGMFIFIISGVVLLYSVHWTFLNQPWFIAKLACFILLPIRGAVIGRRTLAHINTQLQNNFDLPVLMKLKAKMNRFHIIQFILVAAIIFLVLFKV